MAVSSLLQGKTKITGIRNTKLVALSVTKIEDI